RSPLSNTPPRGRTHGATAGERNKRAETERDSKRSTEERGSASPRALYACPSFFRSKIREFSGRAERFLCTLWEKRYSQHRQLSVLPIPPNCGVSTFSHWTFDSGLLPCLDYGN